MKPNSIKELLDLSLAARKKGMTINTSFTGHAGISKTEQVISWVKKQRETNPNFGFVTLRCAFLEAPDFLGLPHQEIVDGNKVTTHYTPEFWPRDKDSSGLIFIDEYNRATTAVMNCLMQLTDSSRGVGPNYKLPEGWIIAGATNPESSDYDTNTADTALKDRFAHFDIEYDHNSFVDFMQKHNWCDKIQNFVKSGIWIYKEPSSIGKDGKYISPRTFERLNSAHSSGALNNQTMHRHICQSILGRDIGNEMWTFVWNESPVTYKELLSNKNQSLKKLKKYSDPTNYRGDFISITVESVSNNFGGDKTTNDQIDTELMIEVASVIPADQAVEMIRKCGAKQGSMMSFFDLIQNKYPKLVDILKANIKLSKTNEVKT